MTYVATVVIVLAYVLGYYNRSMADRLKRLEVNIKERLKSSPPEVEQNPVITMIDADDPIMRAKYERDEQYRRMNPHLFKDDDEVR